MWPDSQEVSVLRERVSSLSSEHFPGYCGISGKVCSTASTSVAGRRAEPVPLHPLLPMGSQLGGAQVSRSGDVGILVGQGTG